MRHYGYFEELRLLKNSYAMLQIKIPVPCHESWDNMTPTSSGAFCKACLKEVVDFTKMTDQQVQHYLLENAGGATCGRFGKIQLQRIQVIIPGMVFSSSVAAWKKYIAILLLKFRFDVVWM